MPGNGQSTEAMENLGDELLILWDRDNIKWGTRLVNTLMCSSRTCDAEGRVTDSSGDLKSAGSINMYKWY